jgi:hypothetical protein
MRPQRALLWTGGGLAAAAAVLCLLTLRSRASPDLSLRTIDGRVSDRRLDRFRPRARPGAGPTREDQDLAQLESAGDHHALAVALLLQGRYEDAARQFRQAGPSPAVLVDQAALALAMGDPAAALSLAERALAAAPELPAGRWNRALALAGLGRRFDAVADFEDIARHDEPGWAIEASQRASQLRDGRTESPPR